MKVKMFLSSFLMLLFVIEVPGINAKQKSLKIVIPSKIRYVHHHHTHVVLMKDKKPYKERSPDAKFHHLHYYEDRTGGGRKNKGVSHHYYIPYLPPPAEDEAEEETIAKYMVTPPKNRAFPKPNFISTRPIPPVYEDQPHPIHPTKYRFYDRNSGDAHTTPRSVMEYYETDPYFPVAMHPGQEPHPASSNFPRYKQMLMPHYTEEHDYEGEQLFYPEKSYYDNSQNFPHVY